MGPSRAPEDPHVTARRCAKPLKNAAAAWQTGLVSKFSSWQATCSRFDKQDYALGANYEGS